MTFKQDWEKTAQHIDISPHDIEGMVNLAFGNNQLSSYTILPGGCANFNITISLKNQDHPSILRVYLRDREAPFREQKLGNLLKDVVPLPQVNYVGQFKEHTFAIMEFIPGITLRDYLLGQNPSAMENLMTDAGMMLAKFQKIHFPQPGFFDADLKIKETYDQSAYISFVKKCLTNPTVVETLPKAALSKIKDLAEHLYPNDSDSNLVHGDFDPANILVCQKNNQWHISGILDWEFAFSGSMLWDVANMMRYAHHMPETYETSFLKGLSQGGITLPDHWRLQTYWLNISSLLDCLARCTSNKSPKQCKDIRELIDYFLAKLGL